MKTNVDSKTLVGTCPGCDVKIRFHAQVKLGEFVSCEECGDELEVVKLHPLKLDWAYSEPLDEDNYFDSDDFYYDEDEYDWDD